MRRLLLPLLLSILFTVTPHPVYGLPSFINLDVEGASTATKEKGKSKKPDAPPGAAAKVKGTPKDDVIVVTGTAYESIDAGRGDDRVTVSAGATVTTLALDPPVNSQPQTTAIDGAEDNDTIKNNGNVIATAISMGNVLKLPPANGSDKDSSSKNDLEKKKGALAVGIQGSEGNDTIINTGTIAATAVTTATDIPVGSSSLKVDIGASEAIAEAVGMDGGSENDTLENTGDVTATATATSLKAEVTSNKGLSTSDDSATAKATTTGMLGGDGQDTMTNAANITAVSTAVVGVENGSGSGGVLTRFSAASAHKAEASSTGLTGGEGDDIVTNTGNITAVSTAVSDTILVDIRANGSARAISTSDAITDATAVDTGDGNDVLTNEGSLTAVASSVAMAQSSMVSKSGKASLSPSTWGGATSSEATATGVVTGSGIDNITNSGAVTAVATSVTETGVATISTDGQATADSTSKAKSTATGIDMGNDDDTLGNTGEITAVATATAGSIAFAFSDKGDASAGKKGMHKGGSEAEAVAIGISADGTEGTSETDKDLIDRPHEIIATASYKKLAAAGSDTITNENAVTAVATAVSGAGAEAISIEGAAASNAASKATAKATAVDAGMGDDKVFNFGDLTAVSTATANSAGFSFSESKKGSVSVNATSDAEAIGLSADGMPASSITETELDISLRDGLDATFSHEKIAATGNDTITNSGAITAVATAESGSAGVSVSVKDANSASAKATATANAIGVDAGGGNDTVDNTGAVTAVATAAAGAVEFSFSKEKDAGTAGGWFSEARSSNGVTADAQAIGIRGDGTAAGNLTETSLHIGLDGIEEMFHFQKTGSTGNDTITNDGSVTAVATAAAGEASVSVSIDGAAKADALSKATAKTIGIDAGGGDDTVINTGSLTAVSTATAGVFEGAFSKKDADGSRNWFDMMFIEQGAHAEAESIGIKGDGDDFSHIVDQMFAMDLNGLHTSLRYENAASSGVDSIENYGALTAVATAVSGAGSVAVSIEGDAKADAISKATSTAKAVDLGMGDDEITNSGEISAVSTATATSVAFSYSGSKDIKKGPSGTVAADATTEAEAIGISADGIPASSITETAFDLSLDGLDTSIRHEGIAATGNDTINNTGDVTSVATAVSASGALSVSTSGANAASAKASAKSSAIGIDAGTGDDSITNTGDVTAVSTATAGAVEISFSKEKDAGTSTSFLKKAFTSNGSVAEAESIGIRGDGTDASNATEVTLHMDFDRIEQGFHHETIASTGNDTITNSGSVTSVATAAAGQISGAIAADYVWIEGAAKADATAIAKSRTSGIEAGSGDDSITNTGAVTAVSTATALALEATFSKGKSSDTSTSWLAKQIVDYGANADAEAVGIKGDGDSASHIVDQSLSISADGVQTGIRYEYAASSGNDEITNGEENSDEASVTAVATAVSGSASFAVSAEGTASSDSSSKAMSTATAIDAGAGDDVVTNYGDLTAVSTATAGALGFSLTESKGNKADAGASAESEAIGISGDGTLGSGLVEATLDVDLEGLSARAGFEVTSATGADTISNDGSVTAVSTAVSGAESVAISLEGAASTNMSSTAKATATAIDAGSGDDNVTNNGTLTAVSTATAAAFSAAIAGKGGDLKEDFKSVFVGGTEAQATAKGLTGDSTGKDFSSGSTLDVSFTNLDVRLGSETRLVQAGGDDTITNNGLITATAVATAPVVDVAIGLDGKATAVSTAKAASKAFAIDAGAGDDTVHNTGELVATAVSTAEAVNIALSKSGALVADTIWKGGTEATAEAVGISGDGEGRDWNASGNIAVTDEAVRLDTQLSTTVVSGEDNITNEGPVVATAVAAVPSLGVAVSVEGTGAAISTATAEAKAAGIDAGAGNDTITNSGDVVATSVATATAMNVAVSKGAALAGNSLWNGGTEATAEAVGISGDGEGRDWTALGEIEIADGDVWLGTELSSTIVTGDDNITNDGSAVATAVAAAPSLSVAVSVDSVGAAVSTAAADAKAAGIDAGAGMDTITNTGDVAATSVATAAAANVAVSKSAALAGNSLWDGTTTATSEAVGISGDGEGQDWYAAGAIEVADGDVRLETQLSSRVAGGDDTITNNGTVAATSVAAVGSLGVSISVDGVSAAASKAESDSRAVGIDGGTGIDKVLNTGEIVATSVATASDVNVAVAKSVALAGNGLWDGATKATSEAVGISGDGKGRDWHATGNIEVVDGDVWLGTQLSTTMVSGDDTLTNDGTVVATSVAAAPSAAVGISVDGASAALSTATADSRAVGMDAGAGNDTVSNTDSIVATADSMAATGNVSVSKGLAVATGGLWDGGATANAEAIGISGDGEGRDWNATGNIVVADGDVWLDTELSTTVVTGEDDITNDGSIVATSVAVAPTLDVAVAVQGVAVAASKATADSHAVGIDAGAGNDTVWNTGSIVATSVANADAISVAVTPSGLTLAGGAVWDGGTTAKSEAVGISGDGKGQDYNATGSIEVADGDVLLGTALSSTMVSGDDNIENNGTIAVTSVAAAPSIGVSVAVSGVATSLSTATAEAAAVGIDAGAGNDIISSTGEIVATSVASANALSVSVTPGGVAVAADSIWDGGTTAESEAIGISGDGKGRDWHAASSVEITDGDVRLGGDASTTVVSGEDTITNEGSVVATSVAEALSAGVSVAEGVAAASSTSTSNSRAVAIDAGSGNDTITNNVTDAEQSGDLVATSVANADAVSVSVTPAGVAGTAPATFDGGTTATSEAVGISGDGEGRDWSAVGNIEVETGDEDLGIAPRTRIDTELASTVVSGEDTITNHGTIVATSVAAAPSVGVSVAVGGVAGAISTATAESLAVAIDAGAGNDTVTNTGDLVSTSVANADAVSVSVAPAGVAIAGGTFWDGGTTAKSEAVGISGDGEGRDWHAEGNVDITDELIRFGTEFSTTEVRGNDTITNEGTIVATSAAAAISVDVPVAVGGVAGAVTAATADSRAAAIDAGAGDDTITNRDELVGTSVSTAITVPVSVAVYGVAGAANSFWDGGSTATSEAVGISGDGEGRDWLAAGNVEITKDSVVRDTQLTSTMVSGNDTIDNTGGVTVTSVAEVPSVSVAVSVIGASAALSSATTESRAVAIDAGAGNDKITNKVIDAAQSGELVATSVSNANSVNVAVTPGGVAVAGNLAWDGGTTATSEAVGISGDGQGRDYSIDDTIEVTDEGVLLGALLSSEAASGDDIITNEGKITATSVAAAPSVGVSVSVIGAAASVSTATAEATAVGIDAGAGNDTVTNTGELTATSVANADAVNVAVGLLGGAVAADALWDGGTEAKASAVGISGDGQARNEYIEGSIEIDDGLTQLNAILSREAAGGNDFITNEGKITATSVVVAPSANVSVSGIGLAVAASTAAAEAEAIAIDAGAGDDDIKNWGELTATSVANADAIAVSVAPGGISTAVNGFFDGGVTAESKAVGISGDGLGLNESLEGLTEVSDGDVLIGVRMASEAAVGNDTIFNDGKITATSVAVAPALTESVTLAGIAASLSTATAQAEAMAIDAGAGDDDIMNWGELTATSVANADAIHISAALIGVSGAADAVWDGGTTATARAVGISGDGMNPSESLESSVDVVDGDVLFDTLVSKEAAGGSDKITNHGKVTATSVVVAPSVSQSTSVVGVAAAMSTATAESTAVAIDAGAGDDTVTNHGELEATAVANADAISLSVTPIGVAVAADAVWDGGTTAKADAVGISGDGVDSNESTQGTIEFADGTVRLGLSTETEAVSGNDTITNTNTIKATSVAVTPSIGIATNAVGVSAAMSTSTAEASAAAIDAGDGDDMIDNSGNLTAVSVANADAVSLAASMVGVSAAGNAAWDGGVTARAQAVGIGGDSQGRESTEYAVEIDSRKVVISEQSVRETTGGNDTIINTANVGVEATAVTVSADVALTGGGIAGAISTATAQADAAGIDAGAGNDTVTNSGDLTVTSDAVGVAVAAAITPIGLAGAADAVWDGGTTAESTAVGIRGDGLGLIVTRERGILIDGDGVSLEDDTVREIVGGRDTITNDGTIYVDADANSTSVGVSATVVGVSAAISTGTARSDAAGIDAGGGDDTVTNRGAITAISAATANTVEASVVPIGVAATADTIWDGGTTAEAVSVGIHGGAGNDDIDNQAVIGAKSTAKTTSTGVSTGVVGIAGAFAATTADAKTTAIDGGDGNDTITNRASLVTEAEAVGHGTSVAIELVGAAATDTWTNSNAQAIGIDGGSGSDSVDNFANIWSTANATATTANVTVGIAGAGLSTPLNGETRADSYAAGILGGDGVDSLTNYATITLNATADLAADAVAVQIAGYGKADISATATADGVGMGGGDGNDELINLGTIVETVKATAPANAVTVDLAGAGAAGAVSAAQSAATGIAGGQGDDKIWNYGHIDVDSFGESKTGSVSVTLAGSAPAAAGNTGLAAATGIDGTNGINSIYNQARIDVLADVDAKAEGAAVTLAGVSQAEVMATGESNATGISLGTGSGGIRNFGVVDVDAAADMTSSSSGFSLAGATFSTIAVGATSKATGLHGGDGAGDTCIYNASSINTDAISTMTVNKDSSAGFGYAGDTGTAGADATSIGIDGGQGNDRVNNVSAIYSAATSTMTQSASSFTFAGSSTSGGILTASTHAVGIDGGAGNDTVSSSGRIDAIAASSFTADSDASNAFGTSGATGTSGALSNALGIGGGAGTDNIEVQDVVNSQATSTLTQTGSSFSFGGTSASGGILIALSEAIGIETGNDSDYVTGSGSLTSNAMSTFSMSDSASNGFGTAGASGSAGATTNATGLTTGAGADYVDSDIDIAATATSTMSQSSSGFTFGGVNKAGVTVKAESSSTGIDGGDSDDFIEERGDITLRISSALTQNGSSFTFGGASDAVGRVYGASYAIGINGGSGNDMVINRGTMTASATEDATEDAAAYLAFTGGSSAAFGGASTTGLLGAISSFKGMVGASGNDILVNFGAIDLEASSWVDQSGSSFSFAGASGTGGRFAAESSAIAIDAGTGNDFIRNEGSINTSADSNMTISGNSSAGLGAAASSTASGALTTAKGIVGWSGNDRIENLSTIDLVSSSSLSQSASNFTAIGGSGNSGRIDSTSNSYGITGDSGSDTIISEGAINIDSTASMSSSISVNVGLGYSGTGSIGSADLYTVGISGGSGGDAIRNSDLIQLTATADMYSYSSAFSGVGYAQSNVDAYGTATGDGVHGGSGDDIIQNEGTIRLDITSDVEGMAHANSVVGASRADMTTVATATATGINGSTDTSYILNSGLIDIDVTAKSEANTQAFAIGVATTAEKAYARAYGYGIMTDSGGDMIFNDGTIDVTATANSNTDNRSITSVGISSGGGNDTIVNSGNIYARTYADGSPGYGTSIDAGAGNDTLSLLGGTFLRGSATLGYGNDTLVLTGSPVVANGLIYAGTYGDPTSGYDTATFYGSGTFNAGLLIGFDEGLKTGIGTYTVPKLPMSVIEVVEGTLLVDSDYSFSPEGRYTAHINPDGNCGVLQVNGTAGLSGDLNVVAERGVYLDGTEYGVLASGRVDGVFNRVNLPGSAILTFDAEKGVDGVDVEVDVASFKTVADNAAEGAIAEYLDRLTPVASGELYDVMAEFQWLSKPEFDRAFASVSPEQYGASSKKYVDTTRKSFEALQGRLSSLRNSVAFAPLVNGMDTTGSLSGFTGVASTSYGFWHKGFIESFHEDASGVTRLLVDNGSNFNSFGFDARFGKNFVAGFGRDHSEVTTTSEFSDGDGVVSGVKHFAYGSFMLDDLYMDLAFLYGDEDYTHQRDLLIGALGGSTASEHDGESFSSYIETGKVLTLGSTIFYSFGSFEYVHVAEEGFTEFGGGPLALKIEDKEQDLLISNLGVRAAKMWAFDGWTIMPEISLAWRYNIEPADYSTTASFVGAPGEYFVIDGKEASTHALAIGASLDIANAGRFKTKLDFNGEVFNGENRYDVAWKLEYNF